MSARERAIKRAAAKARDARELWGEGGYRIVDGRLERVEAATGRIGVGNSLTYIFGSGSGGREFSREDAAAYREQTRPAP